MLGHEALREDVMRFQKGVGYTGPRRARGPGSGDPPYRMSRMAYQARLRNLGHVKRPRTLAETQRLQIEIALATHRGESYRAIARRLGLRSHAHCWRVARRYRRGLIPMLPRDEQQLLAMRDSLAAGSLPAGRATARPARDASRTCPNCGYDGASLYAGWAAGPVFEKYSDEHGTMEICRRCRAERAG
jgi:hypothetical protein